jgi:UDP-glucuronate 4-epimerase
MRKVFVTRSAGFMGFHLSKILLAEGFKVVGYNVKTDCHDVRIKERCLQLFLQG